MAKLWEKVARVAAIENDNELLVELLSRRNEWLLVVDTDSKEILYCNKRRSGREGKGAWKMSRGRERIGEGEEEGRKRESRN